jgi:CHAT domain
MSDVFNMTLNADTVVLAACETALGPVRIGEGVVGFPLAFLFAGARSVLLTQWQIPSGYEAAPDTPEIYPSTTVVTSFYSNWRRKGMSFGEALRQAQLQLYRESDAFKDPFFWGAWQLYGEWLTGETQPSGRPRQTGLESAPDVIASTPHPAANPERAARLNIQYIQDLKNWQALPWWKRLRTKKPDRPTGI